MLSQLSYPPVRRGPQDYNEQPCDCQAKMTRLGHQDGIEKRLTSRPLPAAESRDVDMYVTGQTNSASIDAGVGGMAVPASVIMPRI
jgi:hypothetical protein